MPEIIANEGGAVEVQDYIRRHKKKKKETSHSEIVEYYINKHVTVLRLVLDFV